MLPPHRTRRAARLLQACILAASAVAAHAADIAVLSAGAIEPGIRAAASAFERDSGHRVAVTFQTAPQIRARLLAGEAWDMVIAPPGVLAEGASASSPSGGARQASNGGPFVPIGRVGVGIAVRPGASLPDIATPDAFRALLLRADSVVYNRASTGVYIESLLKRLGLDAALAPKTTRYPDGASVMEHVLEGRGARAPTSVEIGIGAMTEIRLFGHRGLQFVGPLPAALQNHQDYVARASDAAPARAFSDYLAGAAAKRLFVEAGIEP